MKQFKATLTRNNFAISGIVTMFFLLMLNSCSRQERKRIINFPKTELEEGNLIPKPLKIISSNNGFPLDDFTSIHTSTNAEGFKEVGMFLADKIKLKTGLNLQVNVAKTATIISINQLDAVELKSSEAYQLIITEDSIVLNSQTAAGAFRGIQTIRQIIPEISNDTLSENEIWVIPTGKITDAPQFEYRGAMLDVSRHFFNVEDVKKYIDVLSYYKYNVLHLHLTDDQGWRIEIKSWPKLTEIGGRSEVGGESGGFYTQEEYTEIVNYAAARYITIVPEIDMPGHTNSASFSYPFLNGNGKSLEYYEGTNVGFSTFDTRKDSVYGFIDDVIREVSSLTPGPYFHIGGDESHVTKKDDYVYFVNRVEKIVQKYGKKMVGWDEIATANVDSTSISQWWNSKENIKMALAKNMKVILSPANKTYLDLKYDTLSKFGLNWAGYIPVDTAYIWSPESYLPKESILGIEAPLWTETVSNIEELEYLAFPRAIGYSELGWTTKENRDWENYKIRLANQTPYLDRMNIKYYPSSLIEWKKKQGLDSTYVND
jgi:hexosaminidase